MSKKIVLRAVLLAAIALFGFAAQNTQVTPLPGSAIPQWVDELPSLHIVPGYSATGTMGEIEIRMTEFKSMILPANIVLPGVTYAGTTVWGYLTPDQFGATAPDYTKIPSYIGPVVVAKRDTPTQMKFVNNLGTVGVSNLRFWKYATDQTLHWADPLNAEENYFMKFMADSTKTGNTQGNFWPFGTDGAKNYGENNPGAAPIPAVVHLHGGEVPAVLDGGPDAWFTSDYRVGHGYWTFGYDGTTPGQRQGDPSGTNYAVYRYPNTQEAANIWFHDHVLGMTRLNVYAGMAGAYIIQDPQGGNANHPAPSNLPTGRPSDGPIIPLVIQDRMFDTDGELFFPADSTGGVLWTPNPEHPYWVPEFLGDAIVVNGKTWPTVGTLAAPIEAKRYRFLFLNGSNARTYELFLTDPVTKVDGPPMWVIGTDGGYLDSPVKIDPNAAANRKLVVMPGERYDVIIDFNDPTWRALNPAFSGTLIMRNTARSPYPKGATPQGSTVGQILKFFVGAPPAAGDGSFDPASGLPLRTGTNVITRLPAPPSPATASAAGPVHVVRQLTLNEVMGIAVTVTDPVTSVTTAYPGGPLEVLLNNTKYSGRGEDSSSDTPAVNLSAFADSPGGAGFGKVYYSEIPTEGQTEIWELVNLTADAHPIHLHLVQFQLIDRQNFNVNNYNAAYNAAFPGGVFIGGYGPPLAYLGGTPAPRAIGGNPDIYALNPKNKKPIYMQGTAVPALPQEAGWKDTVVVYPGQVTRLAVRWAPTDGPNLYFKFDPDNDLGHGYVWHCHIIDHEDNEMMRPTRILEFAGSAARDMSIIW